MLNYEQFGFSGRQSIYDDGAVRIFLPAEFIKTEEEGTNSVFEMEGFPGKLHVRSGIVEFERISDEKLKEPEVFCACLEGVPDHTDFRKVNLASGFSMTSYEFHRADQFLSCCALSAGITDSSRAVATFELAVPTSLLADRRYRIIRHLLRRQARLTRCSVEEPKINNSEESRGVDKLGIRFPEELGGMVYCHTSDFECRGDGLGVSLRYEDAGGRKADVFIFDNEDDFVEPGAKTEDVEMEMCGVEMEISHACADTDLYLVRDTVTEYREELEFLDKRHRIAPEHTKAKRAVVTATLITAYRGVFIKVRFTPLPGEIHVRHPLVEKFMDDLAQILLA